MRARRVVPLFALLIAGRTPASAAQDVRPPRQLDAGTSDTADGTLASRNERSTAAWTDSGSTRILAATSDGRGIDWGTPARVDNGPPGSTRRTAAWSLAAAGTRTYCAWLDERNGVPELYFNWHDGALWQSEFRLGSGRPVGTSPVVAADFAVDEGSPALVADDRLVTVIAVDPPSGPDELWVNHTDGGIFWSGPLPIHTSSAVSGSIDSVAVVVDGDAIDVLWIQDGALYLQRSRDGGWQWENSETRLDTGLGASGNLALVSEGSTRMVAWPASVGGAPDALFFRASFTEGLSWQPPLHVGAAQQGVHDVDDPQLLLLDGVVSLAWTDDRLGSDTLWLAISASNGNAFGSDRRVSSSPASSARLDGAGGGAALTWTEARAVPTGLAAFSRDGGLQWSPAVQLSAAGATAVDVRLAWNARYGNAVAVWNDPATPVDSVHAGGFRPQTLVPEGTFAAGSSARFRIENWPALDAGDDFGVLVSGSPGNWMLPFGDGRATGLLDDALLQISLTNIPGVLSGFVDFGGAGVTPSFVVPAWIPSGTLLHCVAVSFAPAVFPELHTISDVAVVAVP